MMKRAVSSIDASAPHLSGGGSKLKRCKSFTNLKRLAGGEGADRDNTLSSPRWHRSVASEPTPSSSALVRTWCAGPVPFVSLPGHGTSGNGMPNRRPADSGGGLSADDCMAESNCRKSFVATMGFPTPMDTESGPGEYLIQPPRSIDLSANPNKCVRRAPAPDLNSCPGFSIVGFENDSFEEEEEDEWKTAREKELERKPVFSWRGAIWGNDCVVGRGAGEDSKVKAFSSILFNGITGDSSISDDNDAPGDPCSAVFLAHLQRRFEDMLLVSRVAT